MAKKLGAGLEGLFGLKDEKQSLQQIAIDQIKIAEWQPRKEFDEEGIQELANSIKEYGLLQPILLKDCGSHYEIVAGERRYRACKLLNLELVSALIVNFDNRQALEVSMIENLQRKDLNPIEKAEGFAFLIDKLNVTQEELSEKLGFSRSYITNYLRMNDLSYDVKEKILSGELSVGHAKVLAGKKDSSLLANEVVKKKLSVRDLEKVVYNRVKNDDLNQFENMILDSLKCEKVSIVLSKKSGKIVIEFQDLDKLDEIIQKICF